jgi:hypothetical protein
MTSTTIDVLAAIDGNGRPTTLNVNTPALAGRFNCGLSARIRPSLVTDTHIRIPMIHIRKK